MQCPLIVDTDVNGLFCENSFLLPCMARTMPPNRVIISVTLVDHELDRGCPTMAKTSFMLVGNEAGSPEPFLRPLPATGDDANILGVYDPSLGYNAEDCPYQRPQRKMRATSRAAPFGG